MFTENYGEWLRARSVSEAKLLFTNDQYAVGRNNADTADLEMIKINTSDQLEIGILPVFNGVIDSSSPNETLVTKEYVLNVLAGTRDPKDAVRVATTGNLDIASAPAAIDAVVLNANDRVLLKDQTDQTENGIYVFAATGAALVRAEDFDEDSEVTQGASTIVSEGAVNARRQYLLTTADPITLGVSNLVFARIPNPSDLIVFNTVSLDLLSTDLDTNGYKDLLEIAIQESIEVTPKGGPLQERAVDYTLSDVGSATRIDFGLSGTAGTLGEKLKVILDNYGSSKLLVSYAKYSN